MFKRINKNNWQEALQRVRHGSSSILTNAALSTKKQTAYLLRPPQRITTNPQFKRVLKIFVVLFIIYLILAIIPIKKVYDLNYKPGKFVKFIETIVPYPAATVGKKIVPLKRLKGDITLVKNFIEKSKTSDRYQNEQIESYLYERLIEVNIVKKIAKDYKISISDEEVNDAWNNILVEQESVGDVQQIIKDLYGVDDDHIKLFIYETLLREKIDELPKKRLTSHILVAFNKTDANARKQAEEKIKELQNYINTGTKFESVAKDHSHDLKSRDNGGDIGWIDVAFQLEGKEEQELKKAIFETPINQVSGPVESHLGFHLILPREEKGTLDKSVQQLIEETKNKIKIIRFLKFEEKK